MHQQTIDESTMPVQTGQVIVAHPQQSTLNVIREHGITQCMLGVLTVMLSIGAMVAIPTDYWVNEGGSGIWFGLWVFVTGIIGYLSSRQPESSSLKSTNMGFNICCTVVSFVFFIFFAIALEYFNSCGNRYHPSYYCQYSADGTGIYTLLTLLMMAEFFVSITIPIYCYHGSGCWGTQTTGVIIKKPIGYVVATIGHTGITTNTGYSQTTCSGNAIPYSTGDPAYQPYPQCQMKQPVMMAAQTNAAYSADQYAQQSQN